MKSVSYDRTEVLIKDLQHEVAIVRSSAAWELQEEADARAVEALVAALHDEDEDVRETVIDALERIVDHCSLEPLVRALGDPAANVREAVVGVLAKSEGDEALEALFVASRDRSDSVSSPALWELARRGEQCAVQFLLNALRNGDERDRDRAEDLLAGLGCEDVVERAISSLRNPEPSVRRRAIRLLKGLKSSKAREAVAECLHDSDEDVRFEAAEVLGCGDDSRPLEVLLEGARGSNAEIRRRAVAILSKGDDPRAIEAWFTALNDEDEEVRFDALAGCSKRNPRVWEALAAICRSRSRNSSERYMAAILLGSWGDEASVRVLCETAPDHLPDALLLRAAAKSHPELVFAAAENPGSRLAAVQALRFCPDKRACDVLLAALNDDFPPVRHAAAYSLAGSDVSDDVRVVPALIKTCRDRDKTMRIASAHVLAEIVDTRATDVLIELLEDRETRSSAVEGLCRIGGKRVVSSLVPLLSDEPNCFLRRKVGEGLQRCGWVPGCGEERVAYLIAVEDWEGCVAVGSPAKEQLAACLRDGTDEVRRGAAWALERLDWQPRNVVEEVLFLMAARRISEVVERGESVVPPLLTLLDIYCGDDFELVMWTLVQIGEPATRALVAELLRETSLPHVRLGAAKVLSASGFAPENSCQRMWLLAARQQWEECLAMDTCRGEFLQTLMRWSDRVGLKFDETLRQTIGEVASLFLMDVLPEQEPKVNKFVAELFVQTREGHAEEFLRGLLDDPHDAIRHFAAYTLAEKRDAQAIEVLLTAVDDGECWPHGLMMVRLGEVAGSDARALDVLLRALQDSNWRTRATAASVLGAVGAVGGERTALALLNALSDPEFGDHAAVAESLATLRESRAVPTLIHIMDDRPYDRWFAAKGLKIITGQEGDWDSSERTAGMQEG